MHKIMDMYVYRVGSGRWAYDGVKMVSRSTNSDGTVIVTCQSTHLTSFAVLVDVSGSVSEVQCIVRGS